MEIASRQVRVEGMRLHYREAGAGAPVLLLHGWPTSSLLWRDVMPAIAAGNRVIALDLPGFGESDKPVDASYSFHFHERVLGAFADLLGLGPVGLAVHDLGGPIGLYWALHHPERLAKLALLNTLVYPEVSWAVIAFGLSARLPGVRDLLVSPTGLAMAMRLGVADRSRLTDEAIRGVQAPFAGRDARRALRKAGLGLHPAGMKDIARLLPALRVPVRVIYGARDRILPDVARTMARVARDVPHAEVTVLPDCGHFLQEERPAEIGRMLAEFFVR